MKYRIGLDIGIGSVGWAVISAEEAGHLARIEDFGTRIFDSGEDPQTSESLCKQRRGFRSGRRLTRRRRFRKELLRNHLLNIGFLNATFEDELAECRNADVYQLKLKGLDEKLSPAELYKCLVHTCNHRGYLEFYEPEENDKEAGENLRAANRFESDFSASGKRTVSEYLLDGFSENGFVKYRNRSGGDVPHLLIRRDLLKQEIRQILLCQKRFYPCWNDNNIDRALEIIFAQRDFEDGPGNPDDPTRRYHGFLETLGKCPFYKDDLRGFRGTVISDVFAVTNTLSQYRYCNVKTGEFSLEKKVAKEIVDFLLLNGKINLTDVKRILTARGFKLLKSDLADANALGKALKFLPLAKKAVEESGESWEAVIAEEQFDVTVPSRLHQIGELISKFQTPRRRKEEMKKAGVDPRLIAAFANKRISGTASCGYRYMCDAISAFLNGDIYGSYQANRIQSDAETDPIEKSVKLAPSAIDDPEVRENRVVFKAINETRKIINAIVDVYGSPEEIVIEVASELGKSVEARGELLKKQRANEKENAEAKRLISELLDVEATKVSPSMIERYKLFVEQEGKSAYSQKPLGELKDVVENRDRVYEIDHIIPFSLILDNTLNNKALVFTEENQKKGQRTPLMYLGTSEQKSFIAFVNHLYTRKKDGISRKKYTYYRCETLYGQEAEELLNEWKTRNINDTRYITKYVAGLIERHLLFAGDKKQHVQTVKGSVTQKFRREWFRDQRWGSDEKDRETYLNHALDAVVAANLTRPYIEIGSDSLRLLSIFKRSRGHYTEEYNEYLGKCVSKMKKYYGFDEDYTRNLLCRAGRVPSFVPRLAEEVAVRFVVDKEEKDEKTFFEEVNAVYRLDSEFVVPPHFPVTSCKQDKKFRGTIANSNPVRVEMIDGEPHTIKRTDVRKINPEKLEKLYTTDASLRTKLGEILDGKDKNYTVGKYLDENGLTHFTASDGTVIRKVSLDGGAFTNYWRQELGDGNYTNLSMLKYYCVEVYEDQDGKTRIYGIRYVDLIRRNKKLYQKADSYPSGYGKHVTYLFPNDFVRILNGKNEIKFEGYYCSVYNINQAQLRFKKPNLREMIAKNIALSDRVSRVDVSILGKKGGEIRCSVPFPSIGEKKFR